MILQFALSMGSVLLICELFVRRRDFRFWLASRRKQTRQDTGREQHYAAKH